MTVQEQLTEQVRQVARMRDMEANAKFVVEEARKVWEDAHAEEIANLAYAKAAREEAEAAAKALGLAHFNMTGEKAPVAGLAVKEKTVLTYAPEAALAWAKQTGVGLVPETFDARAIEKVAKATPLPFVTITTEPQVQLASDLTAYLEPA